MKNFSTYSAKTTTLSGEQLFTLCDPQTSGGLLMCVRPNEEAEFLKRAEAEKQSVWKIGQVTERAEKVVSVV